MPAIQTQPNPTAPASGPQPLVPPDEAFWQRYSPHHEFPVSSVVSFTLYFLAGAILWVAFNYLHIVFPSKGGMEVEPIAFAGGGGGGDGGTGGDNAKGREEDVQKYDGTEENLPETLKPKERLTDMPRTEVKPSELPEFDPKDTETQRYIEQGTQQVTALARISGDARARLSEGLREPGSGGGKDGGRDGSKDKGVGPKTGGAAMQTDRVKRQLRWRIDFPKINDEDYRAQLHAMGAMIAVPEGNGQYRLIRDLSQKPAAGKVEDLAQLKRMFWIDNDAKSVGSLVRSLALPVVPDHIVAFFPEKVEADLLRKELKFAGRKESEIIETRFKVVRRGATYEPVVVDQR